MPTPFAAVVRYFVAGEAFGVAALAVAVAGACAIAGDAIAASATKVDANVVLIGTGLSDEGVEPVARGRSAPAARFDAVRSGRREESDWAPSRENVRDAGSGTKVFHPGGRLATLDDGEDD